MSRERSLANIQGPDGPPAGFGEGNRVSRRHGLYSTITLAEEVAKVADELREAMPLYREAFEPLVLSTALLLCQITADPEPPELGSRKSADYRGRQAELRRHLGELGMTPASMARLGFDLARTEAIAEDRLRDAEGAGARAVARIKEETT